MKLYLEKYLIPNWPKPENVFACTTTCLRGPSYQATDFADLKKELNLPKEPFLLKQIHSDIVCEVNLTLVKPEADASFSFSRDDVCAVQTADCVPILICTKNGDRVAAVHAGWRGLAKKIIEKTIEKLNVPANELLVWLGPAICQKHYEVDEALKKIFLELDMANASAFVAAKNPDKWLCDLYFIARQQLQSLGVTAIYGGEFCTYEDKTLFYSYRRDNQLTGRLLSLIYRT